MLLPSGFGLKELTAQEATRFSRVLEGLTHVEPKPVEKRVSGIRPDMRGMMMTHLLQRDLVWMLGSPEAEEMSRRKQGTAKQHHLVVG